jgi:hypothetical protein
MNDIDALRESVKGLAHILRRQYEVNTKLAASIYAVSAVLQEHDPNFERKIDGYLEEGKTQFGQTNAAILELIDQIIEGV